MPSGVSCDPANPACPAGQTCQAVGVCSATTLPLPDAAIDGPPDAQTAFSGAPSDNSGIVYKTVELTSADLSVGEPMKAQAAALAPSQRALTMLQTVEWPLPASLASPNGSVYLELENPSTDGADDWDRTGATPPQLIVDVQ